MELDGWLCESFDIDPDDAQCLQDVRLLHQSTLLKAEDWITRVEDLGPLRVEIDAAYARALDHGNGQIVGLAERAVVRLAKIRREVGA